MITINYVSRNYVFDEDEVYLTQRFGEQRLHPIPNKGEKVIIDLGKNKKEEFTVMNREFIVSGENVTVNLILTLH